MYPKILLVDDNEDLLKITQIILNGQGYQTVFVTTGTEALAQIKKFQPQVILMDVCLCDGNGLELCRQLKRDSETSSIRIILMSGYENPLDDDSLADDFLAKPFDYTDLISKIEKQVGPGVATPASSP